MSYKQKIIVGLFLSLILVSSLSQCGNIETTGKKTIAGSATIDSCTATCLSFNSYHDLHLYLGSSQYLSENTSIFELAYDIDSNTLQVRLKNSISFDIQMTLSLLGSSFLYKGTPYTDSISLTFSSVDWCRAKELEITSELPQGPLRIEITSNDSNFTAIVDEINLQDIPETFLTQKPSEEAQETISSSDSNSEEPPSSPNSEICDPSLLPSSANPSPETSSQSTTCTPGINFHRSIYAQVAKETSDCGYIVASSGKLTKLDESGNTLWESDVSIEQKKHSNLGEPSVIQTKDGGYLYSDNNGATKIDSQGALLWKNKKYRDFNDAIEHSDGHFYLVSDDLAEKNAKAKITKLNANGTLKWRKGFGSCNHEKLRSVLETPDGNLIVVGGKNHGNGTFKCSFEFYDNVWIMKVSAATGEMIWEKSYGGNSYERAYDIVRNPKGGYFIIGTACNKKNPPKAGDYCSSNMSAYWLKIDDEGNKLSQKFLTHGPDQEGFSITTTSTGGLAWVGRNQKNVTSGRQTVKIGQAVFYEQLETKVKRSKVIDLGGGYGTSVEQTSDGGLLIVAGKNVFKTNTLEEIPSLETSCSRSNQDLCP